MSSLRLLALLVLLVPGLAHADTASDRQARAHARTAKAYFEAGDFVHATQEYEAAYALDHKPSRLYNLAVCHERAGDLRGALALYRQYLEADPDGEAAAAAAQSIVALDQQLTEQQRREQEEAKRLEAEEQRRVEEAEKARPAPTEPPRPAVLPPLLPPAPEVQPTPRRVPRWLWPTLAATALATGIVLDTAPDSAHNGELDGLDFVPLGCYGLSLTFVGVWLF